MKSLETLKKISRVVAMIRDPKTRATQAAIALDLNCTDRQVRNYFELLLALDCPLINHGRNGWEIKTHTWDLWEQIKAHCE